jgi:hypothetical protein
MTGGWIVAGSGESTAGWTEDSRGRPHDDQIHTDEGLQDVGSNDEYDFGNDEASIKYKQEYFTTSRPREQSGKSLKFFETF